MGTPSFYLAFHQAGHRAGANDAVAGDGRLHIDAVHGAAPRTLLVLRQRNVDDALGPGEVPLDQREVALVRVAVREHLGQRRHAGPRLGNEDDARRVHIEAMRGAGREVVPNGPGPQVVLHQIDQRGALATK